MERWPMEPMDAVVVETVGRVMAHALVVREVNATDLTAAEFVAYREALARHPGCVVVAA